MDHRSMHRSFGETRLRGESPAPAPVVIEDRDPKLRNVEPFFSSGEPTDALAFTGRGYVQHLIINSVDASLTVVRRTKGPVLPFRSFVRTFSYSIQSASNNAFRPVWSRSANVGDLTLLDHSEDEPMVSHTNDALDIIIGGFYSLQNGLLHVSALNYLLPKGPLHVGIQVMLRVGTAISFQAWFELLEIVEQGG